MAIAHGNRVLSWQENLIDDEMPPEWMWPFSDELETWFEEVDRKRKDKYSGSGSSNDDEESPMMSNELARGRR